MPGEAREIREAKEHLFAYYADAKSKIFGHPNWFEIYNAASRKPRARFTIDRDFDLAAPFAAYKFFVELSMEFGSTISPVRLEKGCVELTISFENVTNFQGKDFRYLMMSDERYHNIFRNFDVSIIKLENFPEFENAQEVSRPSNHRFEMFEITASGRPALSRLTPK